MQFLKVQVQNPALGLQQVNFLRLKHLESLQILFTIGQFCRLRLQIRIYFWFTLYICLSAASTRFEPLVLCLSFQAKRVCCFLCGFLGITGSLAKTLPKQQEGVECGIFVNARCLAFSEPVVGFDLNQGVLRSLKSYVICCLQT